MVLLTGTVLARCRGATAPEPATVEVWVGTRATPPQPLQSAELAPAPDLFGNTLRQVVRVSLGGDRLMIERVRGDGIRVYGATILPFCGSFYDFREREAARQAVNGRRRG